MRWPRGRYNGSRIVGVDLHVVLDITRWLLVWPDRWGRCLAIGPLRVWLRARYDFE